MITYTLPGTNTTRTIDNKFNIGDKVIYTLPSDLQIVCTILKIHVTFSGLHYLTDMFKDDIPEFLLYKQGEM